MDDSSCFKYFELETRKTKIMAKVSVIVPVYNIEKYLQECLDSLVKQTLDDIQVILIDDGSKDRSGDICKKFVEEHPNFEYHYKENGGTASARNMGLNYAVGEYIGFVDSDDWVDEQMFEIMYRNAKESDADILYCVMPGLTDYVVLDSGLYNKEEMKSYIYPAILPHVIETGTFRTVDWGNCSRIFKGDLVRKNNIGFYEKSRRCEDFAFAVECALHANSYRVINEGELYHYRPNENSKSRAYTKNMWKSIRSLMTYIKQITSEYQEYDFGNAVDMCIFYFCCSVIRNEMKVKNKQERIVKIEEIVKDSLCRESVNKISSDGMNKEYKSFYTYILKEDAAGISKYLQRLAWKKKYVTPVLKNEIVRKVYLKIRGN